MRESNELTSRLFLAFAGILLAVGTLMVYSASMTSRSIDAEQVYLGKHFTFLAIALAVAGVASQLPGLFWKRCAPLLYFITVGLLVAVLVPGVGHRVNGAQRWLRVSSFSIQPSELAKLTIPLFLCYLRFDAHGTQKTVTVRRTVQLFIFAGIPLGLTLVEPDLGTTLFLGMIAAMTLFLAGWPLKYFAMVGALVIPAAAGLVALKPYQVERIRGFVATWTNPETAPYQVRQSLTTLGVGGSSGTGLGRGWQKLSFLPEANTDFIFAVIGEELGLPGTLGVIGMWLGLYLCGLRLIRGCPENSFERVVALTLLTQLLLQAALNVAVVTAMVPPKGISHPLISYGGSNLVTSVTALGMILSLTRQRTVILPDQQAEVTVGVSEQSPRDEDSEYEETDGGLEFEASKIPNT